MLTWALGVAGRAPGAPLLQLLVDRLESDMGALAPADLAAVAQGWARIHRALREPAGTAARGHPGAAPAGGGGEELGGMGRVAAAGGANAAAAAAVAAAEGQCVAAGAVDGDPEPPGRRRRVRLSDLRGWDGMWREWAGAAAAALPRCSCRELDRMACSLALLRDCAAPRAAADEWWAAAHAAVPPPAGWLRRCSRESIARLLWAAVVLEQAPPDVWLEQLLSRAAHLAAKGLLRQEDWRYEALGRARGALAARGQLSDRCARLFDLALTLGGGGGGGSSGGGAGGGRGGCGRGGGGRKRSSVGVEDVCGANNSSKRAALSG